MCVRLSVCVYVCVYACAYVCVCVFKDRVLRYNYSCPGTHTYPRLASDFQHSSCHNHQVLVLQA